MERPAMFAMLTHQPVLHRSPLLLDFLADFFGTFVGLIFCGASTVTRTVSVASKHISILMPKLCLPVDFCQVSRYIESWPESRENRIEIEFRVISARTLHTTTWEWGKKAVSPSGANPRNTFLPEMLRVTRSSVACES